MRTDLHDGKKWCGSDGLPANRLILPYYRQVRPSQIPVRLYITS